MGQAQLGRFRVLIVEDDISDVVFLKRAFNRFDDIIDLVIVNDGAKAEALLDEIDSGPTNARPHLIVLDYHLPNMDGDALLEKCRSLDATQKTPVVLFSGDICERLKKLEAEDRYAEAIPKPSNMAGYTAAMSEMLRHAMAVIDDIAGVPA